MPQTDNNNNTKNDTSIDDDDIYTTADDDMKDVKLSHSDDQSIPTSTFTDELFSSTRDDDEDVENGVRKLPPPSTKRRNRSFCCICQRVITPMVLLTIIILFLIYYFGDSEKLKGIIPGTDMLFASEDLGEQYVWRRSSTEGGLTLTIINALDTQWYTYFDTAVSDWDNGTPDALTLTSEVASAPDPDCTTIEGVLKMCNNDYGATDWMGINEVLKYEDEIAGSTGMMNDYYFGSSAFGDEAKRQYTMCHEMGHGFGLPHTDTTMWNRNTGNCLDYTNRPKSNMRPGQINYERLVKVYGTVVGSNSTTTANSGASTSAPSSSTGSSNNGNTNTNPPQNSGNNGNINDDHTNMNDDGNNDDTQTNHGNNNNNKPNQKNNNGGRRDLSNNNNVNQIPTLIHDRIRQLRKEYISHDRQRKLLVRSNNKLNRNNNNNNDHYVVDLGDGYSVEVNFLRV